MPLLYEQVATRIANIIWLVLSYAVPLLYEKVATRIANIIWLVLSYAVALLYEQAGFMNAFWTDCE